jgi:hypothetical protein
MVQVRVRVRVRVWVLNPSSQEENGKRAVKATKAILGHPVGQLNLSGRHFRGSVSVFSNFFFFY